MFDTNNFIFTSETTPEVTTDLTGCVHKVEELIGIADANKFFNFVCSQS